MRQNTPLSCSAFTLAAEENHSNLLPEPATGIEDDESLEPQTDCPPELSLLRTQQRIAMESLMLGRSYQQAAHAADVDRRTLYNWVNKDQAFKAAMDSWRQRAITSAQDRLTQATDAAAVTLGAAATRDYRAAAVLLKGRGLLSGQTDLPRENPIDQVLSLPPNKRQAFEVRLRELILSFKEEPSEEPGSPSMAGLPDAEMKELPDMTANDVRLVVDGDIM